MGNSIEGPSPAFLINMVLPYWSILTRYHSKRMPCTSPLYSRHWTLSFLYMTWYISWVFSSVVLAGFKIFISGMGDGPIGLFPQVLTTFLYHCFFLPSRSSSPLSVM